MSTSSDDDKYDDYIKQFSCDYNMAHCNICNRQVPNNEYNIIQHVEGNPHQNALEDYFERNSIEYRVGEVYYCKLCDSYTGDFWAHVNQNADHNNYKNLCGLVDKHELKYHVYDNPDHPDASHSWHLYQAMLEDNYIFERSNDHYFCLPCKLKLGPTSEIFHMFGERHWGGLHAYIKQYKL